MNQFVEKKVVVIGYGKAALDMSTHSSKHSEVTYHVFRVPRWTLPDRIWFVDFSYVLFSRLGTFMITCWTQPFFLARFVQQYSALVYFFWTVAGWVLRFQYYLYGLFQTDQIRQRINVTLNTDPLLHDKKFVVAILPSDYYPQVVKEKIVPIKDQLVGFTSNGVKLSSGNLIACDMVVLALGNQTPAFPFLPQKQRWLMEREGGAQLYRHLIHPQISRMGFVGFNHCYLHMTAVEVGTLWLIASWRGELQLPPIEVTFFLHFPFFFFCDFNSHSLTGNGSFSEESESMETGKHGIRTNTRLFDSHSFSAIHRHSNAGLGIEPLSQNAKSSGRSVCTLRLLRLQRHRQRIRREHDEEIDLTQTIES